MDTADDRVLTASTARVDPLLRDCGVESFCAVPITHGDKAYGWVVAIHGAHHVSDRLTYRRSEQ